MIVLRIRSGRQVAAVDGGAACGVGRDNAVAEKLREQLEIRRFTATSACPAVFEQRLHHLLLAELADLDLAAVHLRQREEEVVVLAFAEANGRLRAHVDRLELGLGLVLGRADLDAEAAARAIFRRDLQGPLHSLPFGRAGVRALERGGRAGQACRIVSFHADAGVRADHHALAALDTRLLVPHGYFEGQVALLVAGCAGRERAVRVKGADRQFLAQVAINDAQRIGDFLRGIGGEWGRHLFLAGDLGWNLDLEQVGERLVHRCDILLHHLFALAAVGLLDGVFDLLDRFLTRQHARQGEEAGLHDGVDARTHAGGLGDRQRVNHVELQVLLDQCLLSGPGKLVPDFVCGVVCIEQERPAGHQRLKHVVAVQEDRLMAGDEIGLAHQVDRANRLGPEPQVGDRHCAGLLRIIDEVALRVVGSVLANDLDRVLIGANRAVRAEAVEHRAHHLVGLGGEFRVAHQAVVGHVVVDAHREVVLGLGGDQVLEHRLDHRRRELLRREPIPSAEHPRHGFQLA